MRIFIVLLLVLFLAGAGYFFLGGGREILFVPDVSEGMSQEELAVRVGQMIVVGFRGTEADLVVGRMIREVRPGGVILMDYDAPTRSFRRNIVDADQVAKLIGDLQSRSEVSLFVAVDAEGGLVNRLKPKYGFLNIPSAAAMGRGTSEATRDIAAGLVDQLITLGFNMNFAPVVDVNVDPSSPAIGALGRSFSGDAAIVIAHARAFSAAHREGGVIPVLKHFPGHGSAGADSHLGLVDVTSTYEEDRELAPYRTLIDENGVDVIMTAHVMHRGRDADYPATLSKVFLQDILRDQLGFKGVVISDDMQMAAITDQFGFSEAVVRAVIAGNDIILSANNIVYDDMMPYAIKAAILQGVDVGKISIARIREASNRVYALKRRYGIIE